MQSFGFDRMQGCGHGLPLPGPIAQLTLLLEGILLIVCPDFKFLSGRQLDTGLAIDENYDTGNFSLYVLLPPGLL